MHEVAPAYDQLPMGQGVQPGPALPTAQLVTDVARAKRTKQREMVDMIVIIDAE